MPKRYLVIWSIAKSLCTSFSSLYSLCTVEVRCIDIVIKLGPHIRSSPVGEGKGLEDLAPLKDFPRSAKGNLNDLFRYEAKQLKRNTSEVQGSDLLATSNENL